MQTQPTPHSDEISHFILEGTHRLAVIAMNDYGFSQSARLAQTYLNRAMQLLESKRGFDRAVLNELGRMKAMAEAIRSQYAQFEKFCSDCERFKRLETRNWVEWLSKWAVRLFSSGYRGTVSHHLAYKICAFHASLSSLLTEK